MTIRVDISRLPEDVVQALENGETVEFEHDGRVAAVATPCGEPQAKPSLWEALAQLPPLDEDFERDIAILDTVVKPQPYAWER